MTHVHRVHLIQLAGGTGSRALRGGDDTPKQFRRAGGRLLLEVSLNEFLTGLEPSLEIASVTVVVADAWRQRVETILHSLPVAWQLAGAGSTRTGSTWNAVQALEASESPGDDDLVAVHDAARPFATVSLLAGLAAAADRSGAAVPGVRVADTILRRRDGGSAEYLHRDALVAVQTPQVFRWRPFVDAHRWAADQRVSFTDDGGLLAARGHEAVVVDGEPGNWKVTSAADWERALDLLEA